MKIALMGPLELTPFDEADVESYIRTVAAHHEIAVLAYRSIESLVFKYYVNNPELCPNLTIYVVQPLDFLPSTARAPIEYLENLGASVVSFEHAEPTLRKSQYEPMWAQIMADADTVVCFYDGANEEKLIAPADVAIALGKKGFIYYLFASGRVEADATLEQKMRVVEPRDSEFYA